MAYVLGFSNQPFKEDGPPLPPPPPPPPQLPRRSPFAEAGGFFEWTASDGRRGKLTGRGRPRLTGANVAKVPSEKQQSKPASKKSASKKAIAEAVVEVFEETGGLMGLFDDTPAAEEEKKPEASATFTAEQDKTLMDMKNSGNAWTEIAKKLGKDTDDCKERFKLIKLAGWMPTDKGGNQKKQQNKGDNKDKIQRKQSQKAEKKDEKKDENNNADANGNANNGGTNNNENTSNDTNNNTDAFNVPGMWGDSGNLPGNTEESTGTGKGAEGWSNDGGAATGDGENTWSNGDEAWGKDGFGGDASAAADGAGGNTWAAVDGAADAQNTGTDTKDAWENTGTKDAWDNTGTWNEAPTGSKAPSKAGSKAPSKAGSKAPSKKSTPTAQPVAAQTATSPPVPASEPLMYEITPDAIFSADDLRTIARILQQDAKMVWDRVSWRFRDKTGRHLEPDVFEEKITGRVEGREKGM